MLDMFVMLLYVYILNKANCVLNKSKSTIPPLLNGLEVLSSASDKAKRTSGSKEL